MILHSHGKRGLFRASAWSIGRTSGSGASATLTTSPRPPAFQSQVDAKVLKDALSEPRVNRDMREAVKPMPNFSSTPGGPNGTPLTFWANWTLESRPRRIALLLDDAQEEYRAYAEGIIPNMKALVDVFREKECPIVWSSWSRQFDDGISNAMDRWSVQSPPIPIPRHLT